VARINTLYSEAEINERDVHEILNKSEGEIAFVTQPKAEIPGQDRWVGQPPPEGRPKRFPGTLRPAGPVQPWWRRA
jgi:hypothetical protein